MSSTKRRRRRKRLRLHYSFQTAPLLPRWAFDSYVLLKGKRLDQTDLAGSWVNTLTQTQWHLGCARKLLFLRKGKKKKKEGGKKKKKTHASQDDEIFSAPVWKRIFKDKWHQNKQNNPTLAGLWSPGKSLEASAKFMQCKKIITLSVNNCSVRMSLLQALLWLLLLLLFETVLWEGHCKTGWVTFARKVWLSD